MASNMFLAARRGDARPLIHRLHRLLIQYLPKNQMLLIATKQIKCFKIIKTTAASQFENAQELCWYWLYHIWVLLATIHCQYLRLNNFCVVFEFLLYQII